MICCVWTVCSLSCVCVCVCIYLYILYIGITVSYWKICLFCSGKGIRCFFPRPLFYSLSSLIVGNTQSATKFRNEDSELWNKGLICLNHHLLWNGKSMAFDESVLQCDNVKCEIGCLKRLLSLLFWNSILLMCGKCSIYYGALVCQGN